MGAFPKRHHFLPRFYLEGFSRDGWLWLCDRERKHFRKSNPEKTAIIRDFYVLENKSGEKDYSVEQAFSLIEGKASEVIHKLERCEGIEPKERADLALFVALLMTRTPRFERDVQQMTDAAAKHIIKHSVSNVGAAENLIRRSGTNLDPQGMLDFVQKERFQMETSHNFIVTSMVEKAHKFGLDVCLMNWSVLHASDRSSFITTDQPVGFIVPDELRGTREPIFGLASERIIKVVPLTQRVALLMTDYGAKFRHDQMSQEGVREVNLAVATECDGYVIGRDEALVRSVVRASKVDVSNPGTKMRVDHVPHPTDPNRTYLITRRVPADAPDEPPEIVIKHE